MPPTPRSRSTGGLSSQGTLLLALTGAGVAVFLIFFLPSLNASRAAAPRGSEPEARVDGSTPAEPVELIRPIGTELESEAQAVKAPETAVAPSVQGQTLLAADARPKVEGPPLRIARETDGSKPEMVDHRELRETNRARRKERREGPTMEERAFGTEKDRAAEGEKYRTRANPDHGRLNRSGTGPKGQGKGKPKDAKEKDATKDG